MVVFGGGYLEGNPPSFLDLSTFCRTSTKLLFLKGKSPLKLGITSDFITQSKLLGGSTPQTPPRISFSVGCLQAAADTFVII
jgi:hypothetical protein